VEVKLVRPTPVPEKKLAPVPRYTDPPATPTTQPATTATPAATAQPAKTAATNAGFLTLRVLGGWGEVWLDGVKIADRTPLNRREVAAGKRSVRIVNPVTRGEVTLDVDIVAGEENQQVVSLE
jgi:hypothetical protein